jgi:Protein of unknown function (DUF2628)
VKYWTAHTKPEAEPILLREGFSWGALIFGPFWLAAQRAWVPAVLALAAEVLAAVLLREPFSLVVGCGLALFLGLTGRDLCRWSVEHRGYTLTQVLAARDEAEALGRLLVRRPDLARHFMPPEAAR